MAPDPGSGRRPVRNALLVVVPLTVVVAVLAWSGALHPNVGVNVDIGTIDTTPRTLQVDLELYNDAGRPVEVLSIGADRPGMVVQDVLIDDGRELTIPHYEQFAATEITGGGMRRASITYQITDCKAALGSTPRLPVEFRSEWGVHHTAVVAPVDTPDGPLPLRLVLERLMPDNNLALYGACHDDAGSIGSATTVQPG